MNTSFITTVLNEENSINGLLDSLNEQSKKPDEVIIVDAGSTDKTLTLVKKHPLNKQTIVRLINFKNSNRSQARNKAIKAANHQVIVSSDAGCILDEDWLKRITNPLKNKHVDSVAGFYQVETDTFFSKAAAPFVAVMPDKLNPREFLPSSRSIAFRKKAWQKTGQYPENLNYCEDLIFASNLKKQTNMVTIPDALVFWQTPDSIKQFFISIKNYAAGDVKAKYKPHLKKILTVFARYLIFTGFPLLFLFYQVWPILKYYHYLNHPLALLYLPFIQIIKDLAIIIGAVQGVIINRS